MLNVVKFGAIAGDAKINNTPHFQEALNTAGENDAVFVPGGEYYFKDPLIMNNKRMVGVLHALGNAFGSILRLPEHDDRPRNLDYFIKVESDRNFQMENIRINCADNARKGIDLFHSIGGRTRLHNVEVTRSTEVGFDFEEAVSMRGDGLISQDNAGDGFHLRGCNAAVFTNIISQKNDGNGIIIKKSDNGTHTGGCAVFGGTVQNNNGHGIIAETSTLTDISHIWFEGNLGDAIRIQYAQSVNVNNSRITGPANDGTIAADGGNRAIRIIDSGKCRIRDNDISGGGNPVSGGDNTRFATIFSDSTSRLNYFSGNCHASTNNLETKIDTGGRASVENTIHTRNLNGPPELQSSWRVGDIVWDELPTPGENIGWVCISGYSEEEVEIKLEDGGIETDTVKHYPVWKSFGRIEL